MTYIKTAHFSSIVTKKVDLTARLPWLYIIALFRDKGLYVGESFDENGLTSRLSAHFGPFQGSTLRQRVSAIKHLSRLHPPFLVVAARLPIAEDNLRFDGSSKKMRLFCESILHEYLATKFISAHRDWAIVSQPNPPRMSLNQAALEACNQIYQHFENAVLFLRDLTTASFFNLLILDISTTPPDLDEGDLSRLFISIEVSLFHWILNSLRTHYGERWWSDGVPEGVRKDCVSRREEEGAREERPPEAYMTLLHLRQIVQRNWHLFGQAMEDIGEEQGKEKATKWIQDLNELRRLWAHPIKQQYAEVDYESIRELQTKYGKISQHIPASGSIETE